MRKYFINFLLCLTLILCSLPVNAATQDQVTRQENTVQSTINEIADLDKQINTLEAQIIDLNHKIEQTAQELLKAQEEVKKLTELTDNRVRVAYIYGTNGFIEYLFSSEKPADFISHFDIAKDILYADRESLRELEKKQKEIETLQASQIKQRDLLVNTKNQAENLKNEKNKTLTQNQEVLNQLRNSLTESTETIIEDPNLQVPMVSITPGMQDQVITQSVPFSASSIPIASIASIQGNQSISEEEQQELNESDQASAASISPRWLDDGSSSITGTSNSFNSSISGSIDLPNISGQGLISATAGSNPYILEIPNTAGSITQIPRANFPSSLFWPLDSSKPNSFTITSLIGSRESPGGIGSTDHGGIDIGADYGTAIIAMASGTVEVANVYGGYGNAVMINHGNGLRSLYGHMSSIAVSQGQEVQAGQIIGFVGSTGWSTGPHLHFEIRYTDNAGNDSKLNGLSLYGPDILNRLSYYC